MCGFTGIINKNGIRRSDSLERKMKKALDRLYPRGPDQQGIFIDNKSYLVHSRLSILDTSKAGKQPMVKYHKAIIYNGEIYNFKELREKLISYGYTFTSSSDCEVLLAGWDKWGENLLELIDGMYAFAIWDNKEEKLVLVRDPYGKKPLFYSHDKNKISFSSDLKSLEYIIDCGSINLEAVESLFRFRFICEPLTIYNNVRKLPAGHILEFNKGKTSIKKWYTLNTNKNLINDKKKISSEIIDVFDNSVSKRLVSDVPLGLLLSGGLDSSLILASLAEQGKKIPCFTMGFEGVSKYYEERPAAKKLADHFGMKHHSFEMSANNLLNIIPQVFDACDEPFADSSALPFFALSQKVSKNTKVVLSGDGSDEVFGGYRKYIGEKWSNIGSLIPARLRNLIISFLIENKDTNYGELSRRLRRFLINMSDDEITRHISWHEQLSEAEIKSLLGHNTSNIREMFINNRKGLQDKINATLIGDINISLPADMLVKLDRMSMANSLEVRSPFLDKKLVELAFSIPGTLKVGNFQGKKILRDSFSKRLPKWSMNLPKKGFEVPISNWLKKDLKNMLDHASMKKNLDNIGIKNHSMIEQWKNALYEGKRDTSWKLWTLMSYYYWCESKGMT